MRFLFRTASVLLVLVLNSSFYWPALPETGADIGAALPHADKIVHLAVFALTTALVLKLLVPTRARRAEPTGADTARSAASNARVHTAGWAIAAIGAHAFIIEAVQHWMIPTRSGDIADIVADLSGIAIALTGWATLRSRRSRHPST